MRMLVLLSLFLIISVFARSSVWKVSDGEHIMYIGGTIHVLRASDYPLPLEFERAYKKAEYLVFETDMAALNDPEFTAALADKMHYKGKTSLRTTLSRESYMALKKYVYSEGYGLYMFERFKPGLLIITLTGMKLEQLGLTEDGVDAYYSLRAEKEGKIQRHLESVQDQIALISDMGEGYEDEMILQTVRDMEALPSMMKWIAKAWREGDVKWIEKQLLTPMIQDFPEVYDAIIKQRNDRWMVKLLSMIREKKTGLVLVGTMHLPGKDGLLEEFRCAGFTVEEF